jgi:hypothetical protein
MKIIIVLSIIVVFIAYFARFRQSKYALELSFFIIYLFTAFRYNYGTDYTQYQEIFESVASSSNIFSVNAEFNEMEKAWLIICYLFKPIGFFGMMFVLSAIICYTYYAMIKKYVDVNYYWLAVLLYVFTIDIMLIQFSALRQALAIALFLYSIRYLVEIRSPIKYLILNFIAGSFHSSAYFMLIFVLLAFVKDWNSNKAGYIISVFFFVLLFAGKYLMNLLPMITAFFVGERYLYIFDSEFDSTSTLIGGAFWSLLFMIVIFYSRSQSADFKYFFLLYSLFFVSYSLTNLFWIGDRMGYYFAPFSLIVIPRLLDSVNFKLLKSLILILYLSLVFSKLISFHSYSYFEIGYENYQTIFSLL